ncbi:hypothetical protein NQZ79_g7254 [Umbelopsis isabellina]|nr:hypothetical protein NQZ79_g7254 [Umbelopsis isabellina]
MRLLFCFLIAAWATASSALSLASPAPNSTLPIGEMFSVGWMYTQVAAASDRVTVSLLSSPSTADVVEILFTDIPEQFNEWPATVSQATPNTEYYLFLDDTTSPGVVAGPYYFASSESLKPPGFKLPGYAIAIIVVVAVLAIIAIVLKFWLYAFCLQKLGFFTCCGKNRSQSGHIIYHNEPQVNEMLPPEYNGQPSFQDQKSLAQAYPTAPQLNSNFGTYPMPIPNPMPAPMPTHMADHQA